MDKDDLVMVEFHRSVDMEDCCVEFTNLKNCVYTGGHEKKSYEGLIKEVNRACKKYGWRLELVKAREEEKITTDYWIKQKNLSLNLTF